MVKKLKVSKNISDSPEGDSVFSETEKPDQNTPVQSEKTISEQQNNTANSGPRYGFSTEIPDKYNESYVFAVPRNPQEMYVYWEVSPEDAGKINSNNENASKLILRLKEENFSSENQSDSEKEDFFIEIDNSVCSKIIELPQSGKKYVVESGFISSDGDFKPVASSESKEISPSLVKDTCDSYPISLQETHEIQSGADIELFDDFLSKESNINDMRIMNLPDSGSSPYKW